MAIKECNILSPLASHIFTSKFDSASDSFVIKFRDFNQLVLPLRLLGFNFGSLSFLVL